MSRLSSPLEQMGDSYEVLVIGSGYGGGIAASRMARAGRRVCLLERGRELQPGEYPNTELTAAEQMQMHLPGNHLGSRTGMFDFHVHKDMNVLVGCGLGGTSLINANVSLEAEPRVFYDPCWPAEIRLDLPTRIADGYRHARAMLQPNPCPAPNLDKLMALQASAASMQQKFYPPPINVTFEDRVNPAGVHQPACTLCGDCVSGCNVGAKNTTLMNYLPDAVNHGAEIYTQVQVRRIEPVLEGETARWRVHYQVLNTGREKFDAPTLFVTADVVILSAGVLGSSEILLRSAGSLPLSPRLGDHFSGNGDVLGFGYNGEREINGVGFNAHAASGREPVGPCIAGIIDMREQPVLNDGMVIEEGSIPGALAGLLPASFALAKEIAGTRLEDGPAAEERMAGREAESLLLGGYHGAVRNTQTYLVMTHDGSNGQLRLEDDRLVVDWPGVGDKPIFEKVNGNLTEASRALGGWYVRNPIWSKLMQRNLISVHPLGGCAMGEDAARGVVNHKGQVFAASAGTAVHEGLYVMDGAVVPRSLGVNPLLTISALAERACALLAADHGWTIDYSLPSARQALPAPLRPGIEFTETMKGFFSTEVTSEDYESAARRGKTDGSPFEFTLTIVSEDLEQMLQDPNHTAALYGTVDAPALASTPLSVTRGTFNLFQPVPGQVETRHMTYRMEMEAEDGSTYQFEGYKVVTDSSALRSWSELSTLYITVRRGGDNSVLGRGILHIEPADFLKQMTTLNVTHAGSMTERLEWTAKFGSFFAGVCWQAYGGVLAPPQGFNPDAPARQKRPLRAGAPEVTLFQTSDGVTLRLTRYRGGSKGPVMLSHGLGVSSLIFSIDTIEVNLLEYLYAHGYDVWLLDYRNSIALSAAALESSGDDVATRDYPAAVAKVLQLTGAPSLQAVVHCWGSTTFFMALLAGLEGVRSVVCSQIATEIRTPLATRLKTGLHLPSFLDSIGVESLTAAAQSREGLLAHIYDRSLSAYSELLTQRCNDATCHRITFLYAPLYEHDQLNQATHENLHEMFGIANIRSFVHLQKLTNTGHLVNFEGQDVYLPHLERLRLPICFIHGANNECFLPESTRLTYDTLRQKFGDGLYKRHVIPGYGHIDCIYGKNAVRDVYPLMLAHLEETAVAERKLFALRS